MIIFDLTQRKISRIRTDMLGKTSIQIVFIIFIRSCVSFRTIKTQRDFYGSVGDAAVILYIWHIPVLSVSLFGACLKPAYAPVPGGSK